MTDEPLAPPTRIKKGPVESTHHRAGAGARDQNADGRRPAESAVSESDVETRGPEVVSRQVWDEVLAADPCAVATQTPQWVDAVCSKTGLVDASMLLEAGGRRIVVPLVARRAGRFRLTAESWPYGWGYGGALVEGGGLRTEDAAYVLATLRRQLRLRTTVMPSPTQSGPWEKAASETDHRVRYQSQVIDLRGGREAVTAKFTKNARYSARKAERLGVEVHCDTTGAFVEDFARLYSGAIARWADQRGQPRRLMQLIERWRDRPGQAAAAAAALGEKCVAWVATWHGEPVEVALSLCHGSYAHGWLAVNDRRLVRETRGSALLKVRAIEDACDRGMSQFLLGESDPGSPVESFKRQFGAVTVAHQGLRLEPLPFTPTATRLRRVVDDVLSRRQPTGSVQF